MDLSSTAAAAAAAAVVGHVELAIVVVFNWFSIWFITTIVEYNGCSN